MSESNDEKVMGWKVFLLEAVMYKRRASVVKAYKADPIDMLEGILT